MCLPPSVPWVKQGGAYIAVQHGVGILLSCQMPGCCSINHDISPIDRARSDLGVGCDETIADIRPCLCSGREQEGEVAGPAKALRTLKLEFLDLPLQLSCSRLCLICSFAFSCELAHQTTHNIPALIAHAAEYALNRPCACRTQLLRNRLRFVLNGAD
jgi:hypothetical protein